jgi:hypothetical protein
LQLATTIVKDSFYLPNTLQHRIAPVDSSPLRWFQ